MKTSDRRDPQLHSLERWRTSNLEQAQSVHAEKIKAADECAHAVDSVQSKIDEAQFVAREQMSAGNILSVESLTRIRHFSDVQVEQLRDATDIWDRSKQAVLEAQAVVREKYEELAVVERLRERRSAEAGKERLRQEQKRLDEQALLRMVRESKSS